MKDMTQFIDQLLLAANNAGVDPAEVYFAESQSFSVSAKQRAIDDYAVSDACGLGLRGTYKGKMGYASTQAFDEAAITQLIEGVIDSATLVESPDQDEIYPAAAKYPKVSKPETDLDSVTARDKIDAVLKLEEAAQCDPRITQVEAACVGSSDFSVRIKNTLGMDLHHADTRFYAGVYPVAREGEDTAVNGKSYAGRMFRDFSPEVLGREAGAETLKALHGRSVPAGEYPVILRWEAVRALLSVFSGIFSAESAQKKLSQLLGREGEIIAAACVNLIDDPLLPGGVSTMPFDGEGTPTFTKHVIRDGKLETLLHNHKTAKKQGVQTTGNAHRSGYAGVVGISPSNFYLAPGAVSLQQAIADMGNGLLIYELGGLHAGANMISGDFSLICKGFKVENGQTTTPVEQITVAGNFYHLLQDIQLVCSDLEFDGGSIGAPSVVMGAMSIAGEG